MSIQIPNNTRQNEEDLICEALVREIGRGGARWVSRVEAWHALLAVRRHGQDMAKEEEFLRGDGAEIGKGQPGPQIVKGTKDNASQAKEHGGQAT